MQKSKPIAEILAKELGYNNAKELRAALRARDSGDWAQNVKSNLEQGVGFKEAFSSATQSKISSIKETFSMKGVKKFGKNVKKEFFKGDDIFSAYMRGKMRKKEGDEKDAEESSGDSKTSLSEDSVSYLRIIAKNSISLHNMARDVNVLRRNIVELVNLKKPKKKGEKKNTFGGEADKYFKSADEKEALLEAELNKGKKKTTPTQEKKTEKKDESESGGGFLDSIMNMFKGGLLESLSSLLNPMTILKLLGKIFVIGTIIASLFKGITAAFDAWKETGSLKEAIISGLGAIVEFLSFGFFGKDTIRDLFDKVESFIGPMIDTIKDVYYKIKDWIVNNLGIPKFKVFGYEVGPWYPFKSDPKSEADEISKRTEDVKGEGGKSGGAGATGTWSESSKNDATQVQLIGGESIKLQEGVTYNGNTFMYKGVPFNASNQKEMNAMIAAIDNKSIVEIPSENNVKVFNGMTGETNVVEKKTDTTPSPATTSSAESASASTPTAADAGSGGSAAGGLGVSATGTGSAAGSEGAAGSESLISGGPSAQAMTPTQEADSGQLSSAEASNLGSQISQQSSDLSEAQRMESAAEIGNVINAPTTNNTSGNLSEDKSSPSIVDVYDVELAKRLLAA